jgi:hypothetical protein
MWQRGLAPILREQMIDYGRLIDTWVEISTLPLVTPLAARVLNQSLVIFGIN